jgi:hypothetical protein
VRRDGFCFAGALEDEELGEDGDGFKEDGERPEDLRYGVGVIEEDSEYECGAEEVLDTEDVDGWVVRRPGTDAEKAMNVSSRSAERGEGKQWRVATYR